MTSIQADQKLEKFDCEETNQSPKLINKQNHSNDEKLKKLVLKYEIEAKMSNKLKSLEDFKIVFVFDDSGSMHFKLNESPLKTSNLKVSRWDELKYFAEICIEVANVFDEAGTDIYFLNRPTARNIRKPEQLEPHMVDPPYGFTPITQTITNVLLDYNPNVLGEKKLLIVIVTDGEPTNEKGEVDIDGFKQCLVSRPPYVYTTIVSCTDEEETMRYLNHWDSYLPRLDVVDDYKREKTEILSAQGKGFHFSFGDYVVKSLVGSIDSELDDFDSAKLKN